MTNRAKRIWSLGLLMVWGGVALASNIDREWRHDLAEAGYEGSEQLLELLRAREEARELRFKAAFVISLDGRKADASVIEQVMAEPGWSEQERVLLANNLMRLDEEKGVQVLRELLLELDDRRVRLMAMAELARQGLAPRYGELLQAGKSGTFPERRQALRCLRYLAQSAAAEQLDPAPTQVLMGIGREGSERVRREAVKELGLILLKAEGPVRHSIGDFLCERKSSDPSEKVRRKAREALELASIFCKVEKMMSGYPRCELPRRRTVAGLAICLALAVGPLWSREPCDGASRSLTEKLQHAGSEEELDEAVREAERTRIAMVASLTRLLETSESDALRKRACYLIGIYRLGRASRAVIDHIDLKETDLPSELDRIPRWFEYPCAEALSRIGSPAERHLLGAISTAEDACRRDLMLHVLLDLDGSTHRVRKKLEGRIEETKGEKDRARVRSVLVDLEERFRRSIYEGPCVRTGEDDQ